MPALANCAHGGGVWHARWAASEGGSAKTANPRFGFGRISVAGAERAQSFLGTNGNVRTGSSKAGGFIDGQRASLQWPKKESVGRC
jgi:hypothetical protein